MEDKSVAKYEMKYMFDFASGVCIWSVNTAAREKYGYPVKADALIRQADFCGVTKKRNCGMMRSKPRTKRSARNSARIIHSLFKWIRHPRQQLIQEEHRDMSKKQGKAKQAIGLLHDLFTM